MYVILKESPGGDTFKTIVFAEGRGKSGSIELVGLAAQKTLEEATEKALLYTKENPNDRFLVFQLIAETEATITASLLPVDEDM